MPRSARSFADDIRARSAQEIAALLVARPDCARPQPTDLTALAARAQTRASVQRALEGLDASSLHLLEAVMVVGSQEAHTRLLATKRAVTAGLSQLWSRGLLWRSSNGYTPVRAVGDILTSPAGLGPLIRDIASGGSDPALDLATKLQSCDDPEALVEQRRAELSAPAQEVLSRLQWTNPRASFTTPKLQTVRAELVTSGLMVSQGLTDAVIPREVGMTLRGGRLFEAAWDAPAITPAQVGQEAIDAAGASVVTDLLWRLDDIADFLDAHEPRVLRSGGLSVRDHRRLAIELDAPSDFTAFLLELGHAANLFASDGEIDPAWRPTGWYDEWAQLEVAHRWAVLALAWRDTARAPSLAGETVDGTLINVLGRDASWPLLRSRRRDVLAVLREVPEGHAPSLTDVDELLRWQRPLRLPDGAPTRSDVVLREAEWLGVTGRGGLTSAGRALIDLDVPGDADVEESAQHVSAVVEAIKPALPRPAPGVMLQADLTAIAPGPLEPAAASVMRRVADVESRGGATVFRFSTASVRRYLDAGHSPQETLDALRDIAITPLPQPLEYLISDVARRFGQLRVGSVGSYVRSSDDGQLEIVLADSSLAHLQLRRLSDNVLVSPLPATNVLDALRAAGQAPVAETSDGGVVVRVGQAPRATTPRRRNSPLTVSRLSADEAAGLAETLLAREGESAPPTNNGPRIPSSDPTVTLTTLDDAAAEQVPVWIGYVDASGDIKRTLFRPERIEGGRVIGQVGDATSAADANKTRTQSFSIHRITGVAPA